MWSKAKQAILESSESSSIYIGCDSLRIKKNNQWFARYSTVVVLHRDSCHGCSIFHDTITLPDFGTLKERLLNEVNFSVQTALELVEYIGDRHLEIHLDINPDPKHKSSIAFKEAMGWVQGMGFIPKGKPDGFAAMHGADHVGRRKGSFSN